MHAYIHTRSQVLLTGNDLNRRASQENLLTTINSLLGMKVLPVLNGNDVVALDTTQMADEHVSTHSLLLNTH